LEVLLKRSREIIYPRAEVPIETALIRALNNL